MRASNMPKGIVGFPRTQKVLATAAPARQRPKLSGARHADRSPASKCVISCVRRARSGAPTHSRTQPQKRHAHVLSTCTDASRDPFALKRCLLETYGTSKLLDERPTSPPSKPIMLSVTRVMSGASTHITHMHRNTPHAYFGHAQTPPWTPLHSKRAHNIRPESARISWTSEQLLAPSKCIMWSAAPVQSGVLMHTPVGTLRTRALAMPKACREPFAVIWCSQWHLS